MSSESIKSCSTEGSAQDSNNVILSTRHSTSMENIVESWICLPLTVAQASAPLTLHIPSGTNPHILFSSSQQHVPVLLHHLWRQDKWLTHASQQTHTLTRTLPPGQWFTINNILSMRQSKLLLPSLKNGRDKRKNSRVPWGQSANGPGWREE